METVIFNISSMAVAKLQSTYTRAIRGLLLLSTQTAIEVIIMLLTRSAELPSEGGWNRQLGHPCRG